MSQKYKYWRFLYNNKTIIINEIRPIFLKSKTLIIKAVLKYKSFQL